MKRVPVAAAYRCYLLLPRVRSSVSGCFHETISMDAFAFPFLTRANAGLRAYERRSSMLLTHNNTTRLHTRPPQEDGHFPPSRKADDPRALARSSDLLH
uniref:Uncharacterized protein n=1 Tax=Anopheles marajoara TaxID=58244 RepID=A0A2M4C8W6_9DIPT